MELYSYLLVKNLQLLRGDINPTFEAFFYEKEPEIRKLIKERWLLGKRPDGSLIGRYRDFDYADAKEQLNPLAGFGNVDLIDTGALWRGIEIFGKDGNFEIFSTDSKYTDISNKYGEDNFNLTEEETNELINEISVKTLELLYNKYTLQ